MEAYMYQGAFYCADCGENIKNDLPSPENPDDECSFDSDDYPKGPYRDGPGECDSPHHCDSCGLFLENGLTSDGVEYVKEAHSNNPTAITEEWMSFYGFDLS